MRHIRITLVLVTLFALVAPPTVEGADPTFVRAVDESLDSLRVFQAFRRLENKIARLGTEVDNIAGTSTTRPYGWYTMTVLGKAVDDFAERQVLASVGGDSCSQTWIAYQKRAGTPKFRREAAEKFVAALMRVVEAGATPSSGTPGPTGATPGPTAPTSPGLTREEVAAIVQETVRQELGSLDSLKAEVSQMKEDLAAVAATLAYLGERQLVLGVEKKGKDKLGSVTTGTLLDEETRRALRAIKPPSSP